MKQATARDVVALIDAFAPFDTAVQGDNVGLLVGNPDAPVDTVLVALDLTPGVIEEAVKAGAQLILTHHPIMYSARRNLREDDAEGALISALCRAGIAMIAAHTNFDAARDGVSEILAAEVGVQNLTPVCGGLVSIGDYSGTLRDLEQTVRERVNPYARVYGKDRKLLRVAACGGAGSDFWPAALEAGADCYLLGEIKHHDALAAVQMGLCMIDAGHYETEHLSVNQLAHGLQTHANALQCKIRTIVSVVHPFT